MMRSISLLIPGIVMLFMSGCVTQQPQSEPAVWAPTDPQYALVVFTDDHTANSLDRRSPLAQSMQQQAVDQLSRYDYDTVAGSRLTQSFLNHPGRRAASLQASQATRRPESEL